MVEFRVKQSKSMGSKAEGYVAAATANQLDDGYRQRDQSFDSRSLVLSYFPSHMKNIQKIMGFVPDIAYLYSSYRT
jgi:hypothetical protein